jgi:hypothetical protein
MRFGLLCSGAAAFRLGRALLLRLVPTSVSGRARAAELWAMEVMFVRGLLDAIRQRPIPFDQLGMANSARPPFP